MLPSVFGENLFDEFFGDSFEKRFFGGNDPLYGKHAKNLMKTDVRETENQYELSVDLPGFKKDEIQVELNEGVLTISAKKSVNKDETDKKGRYIRQERYAGSCARSFYVGDVRPEDIAERRSVRVWDRSEGQFWVLPPLPLKINVTGIQRVPESIRSPIWLLRIFIWKTGITTRS